MTGRTRRIGPIGTTTRLIAAAALLYLALFDGASWGLRWYDAVLAGADETRLLGDDPRRPPTRP